MAGGAREPKLKPGETPNQGVGVGSHSGKVPRELTEKEIQEAIGNAERAKTRASRPPRSHK
jgi:hypothetical protein